MDNSTLYSLLFTNISEDIKVLIKKALSERDYGVKDMLICKIEKQLDEQPKQQG